MVFFGLVRLIITNSLHRLGNPCKYLSMKNLSFKIWLVIFALFGSASVGFSEESIKPTTFNLDTPLWKVRSSCLKTPVNCTNVELCILFSRGSEVGGGAGLKLLYPDHFVIKSALFLECKIKKIDYPFWSKLLISFQENNRNLCKEIF